MIERLLSLRVIRFGLVGVVVAVVFSALNWVLGHWFGKDASFLLAYPPALALHFWLSKTWTFGSTRTDAARQVGEYLLMAGITFALQAVAFKAITHWQAVPGWAAAAGANALQMIVTFLAMRYRIFRSGPQPGRIPSPP